MGIVGKMGMVGKRYNTHSTQNTQNTQKYPQNSPRYTLPTPSTHSLFSRTYLLNLLQMVACMEKMSYLRAPIIL